MNRIALNHTKVHISAPKETKGAPLSTDLSGIGLRLREVRKSNDLTQPVMAAAIDVSDRTYKYYEQEKRELPALAAVKISDRFNTNLEWLLTGNGQVLEGDNPALAEGSRGSLCDLSSHTLSPQHSQGVAEGTEVLLL